MSINEEKIAKSLASSVTHSNISTSIEQFNDTKLETIHGHVTSFHEKFLFPLLGETNRLALPLITIKIFEYIFLAIQIYLLGQFSFLTDSFSTKNFRTIYKIFYLGFSGDVNNVYGAIIAIVILHLLTGVFLLSSAAIFNNSHEIHKIALYLVRIWNGCLYHLLIIPNSLFLFTTFTLLGENNSPFVVFLCIISGICLLFSLYHYFFVSLILNRSPYLSNTVIQLWRPNIFYKMIIIYSISAGIYIYSKNFNKFYRMIPSFFFVLSSSFFSYQFFYDNFSNIFFNALFVSVSISGSISSILSVINIFLTNPMNKLIFYLLPFCIFILTIILSSIFIQYGRKKIKKQLQYPIKDMTNESKFSYFDEIGIKTKNQAFMYLQNGLENASDLFVDFSLHTYIKEKFDIDNEVFVILMWYVAFFPGNNILLQVYLKQFSTIISPSYYDKSLFLQIHRVHVFRQSSAYKESESDYKKLHHYTDKLIAQYTNLWHNIEKTCDKESEDGDVGDVIDDILTNINSHKNKKRNFFNNNNNNLGDDNSIPALNNLSKIDNLFEKATALRLVADLAWVESIRKYPNNSRFANEYSRYLLKGRCRYKKGLKWKSRAEQLEQGKKLEHDQMFFHFINTYPHYIKRQIVDYEGAFIPVENRKYSSSRSSSDSISSIPLLSSTPSITSTNSSSSSSSSYSETSSEISDNEDMSEKDQLLLSMERAVSVISSSNITRILISAICRLLLTLAYSVVCFILALSLFYDKGQFFEVFKHYSKATNYIELANQQIIWTYANALDKRIMSISSISDSIGPYFYKHFTDFEVNLTKYIFNISSLAMQSYSSMAYETYKNDFSPSKELVNLTEILSRKKIDNNFCYVDKKINDIEIVLTFLTKSSQKSITADFLIRNMIMSMVNLSFQKSDERKLWSGYTEFCTFVYYHWDFYDIMTEITKQINPLFNSIVTDYFSNNYTSKYLFSDETKTINDYIVLLDKYNSSSEDLSPDDSSTYLDLISNVIVSLTPFVCTAFILPLVIFLSVGVNQEWQSYIGILQQFSPNQIEKAMSKSKKRSKNEKYNDKTLLIQDTTKEIPSYIPNVISALIVIISLLLLGILSRNQIQDINHAMMQFSLINQVHTTLFSMATDLIFLLHLKEIEGTNEIDKYLTVSNFTYHIDRQLDLFTIAYNIIQYGGPNLPGNMGRRKEFRNILHEEKCKPDLNSKYPIDYYDCISSENLIHYYVKTIKMIYNAFDQYSLKSDIVVNVAYLTRTRLLEESLRIINKCEEIYLNRRKMFIILAIIFLIIAILACIIAFIFDICIIGRVKHTIETFKDLSLRIDPIDFVTNEKMISLIYGKSRMTKPKISSATHALFYTSKHGMLYVNNNLIIEDVNQASFSIFGFTSEQMIGQHISVFIPEKFEQNEKFYHEIQMMSEGRRSLTYKDEVIAVTDNGTQLNLSATLIGSCPNSKISGNKNYEENVSNDRAFNNTNEQNIKINKQSSVFLSKTKSNDLNEVKSRRFAEKFNIIFEDKSEENNSKAALEMAQKQSQSFLTKLFPPTILTQIIHRSDPISFEVNLASIAFIDIDKFSTFVDTFNSSLMLQNIKAIMKSFDALLSKYFLLTKVKVFGDCYMVAAGLFNADVSQAAKANQILLFCFDCIESIEEININLNSSFQIRVGVHTGGPVIAGVFGTERPIFDVVGTPIQTAYMIQKSGKPNFVRISQDTYELVATNPFNFENDDAVKLKDNREINTYNVVKKTLSLNGCSRNSSCFFSSLMASMTSDLILTPSMSTQFINTDNLLNTDDPLIDKKQIRPSFSDNFISENRIEQMINLTVSESEDSPSNLGLFRKKSSQFNFSQIDKGSESSQPFLNINDNQQNQNDDQQNQNDDQQNQNDDQQNQNDDQQNQNDDQQNQNDDQQNQNDDQQNQNDDQQNQNDDQKNQNDDQQNQKDNQKNQNDDQQNQKDNQKNQNYDQQNQKDNQKNQNEDQKDNQKTQNDDQQNQNDNQQNQNEKVGSEK